MDNRLFKDGFVITLGPLIESTLKLLSFFYKKTLQAVFFPSLYREVFLNTYPKGAISIVIF